MQILYSFLKSPVTFLYYFIVLNIYNWKEGWKKIRQKAKWTLKFKAAIMQITYWWNIYTYIYKKQQGIQFTKWVCLLQKQGSRGVPQSSFPVGKSFLVKKDWLEMLFLRFFLNCLEQLFYKVPVNCSFKYRSCKNNSPVFSNQTSIKNDKNQEYNFT